MLDGTWFAAIVERMKPVKPLPRSHVRVGRSRTGLGLFAAKPIKKGAVIVLYTGKLLRTKDTVVLQDHNRYLYEINKRWTIDGATRKNLGRYINHSCRPNAESDTRKRQIFIRSTRKINAGEEINYHYGRDYLVNWLGGRKKCLCVSCIRRRSEERALVRKRAARKAKAKAGKSRQRRP